MIQIIILFFLAAIVILIATFTGVVGWIWLLLFKQELNLPFDVKQDKSPPEKNP